MTKDEAEKVVKDWIVSWYGSNSFDTADEELIVIEKLYQGALIDFKHGREFDFGGNWRNENDYEDEEFQAVMKPIYDALEVLTDKEATEEYRKTYYSCCI